MADEILVKNFADGIALAEGYFVSGSRPNRNNNPGDLTIDIIGKAVGHDGPFVVYRTPEDGWEALRKQVRMAFDDASRIYNSSMTIREFAQKYTTTDSLAWAQTVAEHLGVSLDTRLSQLTSALAVSGGGVLLIFALLWFMGKKRK